MYPLLPGYGLLEFRGGRGVHDLNVAGPEPVSHISGEQVVIGFANEAFTAQLEDLCIPVVHKYVPAIEVFHIDDGRGVVQYGIKPFLAFGQGRIALAYLRGHEVEGLGKPAYLIRALHRNPCVVVSFRNPERGQRQSPQLGDYGPVEYKEEGGDKERHGYGRYDGVPAYGRYGLKGLV